jgi:lipopolysaccharide transport system ATP-binding protein
MKPIIEIRNLGKQYSFAEAQPYLSLRDSIHTSFKKITQPSKLKNSKFWALQDINLDIQPGERLGIIGRNGAGKSTLLKILSKITAPTTGEIKLRGRIASLLEVGTGFHPELTGKENIFLNGAILGLTKKEIQQRLEEIIDFSGVEKFIDTPLKHYSSGMQLRLAFSVAAHLEPEILLIDEVLAVGDMEFQKKCLGKMEEVSKTDGRTILFVSHNLAQLKQICNTAALLDKGKLIVKGKTNDVIRDYSGLIYESSLLQWKNNNPLGDFIIQEISIQKEAPTDDPIIMSSDKVFLKISITAGKMIKNSLLAVRFTNQENTAVFTTTNADEQLSTPIIEQGEHSYKIPLPTTILTPGRYSVIAAWIIPNYEAIQVVENEIQFELENSLYAGHILNDGRLGIINPILHWEKIS